MEDILKAISRLRDDETVELGFASDDFFKGRDLKLLGARVRELEKTNEEPMPLCETHRKIEFSHGLTLTIRNKCVACSLGERAELLAILASTTTETDSIAAINGLVARVRELETKVERLRSTVVKCRNKLDRIDNGRCCVCSFGFRSYDHNGQPGICDNVDCFSHELAQAALKAEGGRDESIK